VDSTDINGIAYDATGIGVKSKRKSGFLAGRWKSTFRTICVE
jgi:hypothetical protein